MNKNIHGSSMYNSKITAKVSTNSRMAKKKKMTYSYKKQVAEGYNTLSYVIVSIYIVSIYCLGINMH